MVQQVLLLPWLHGIFFLPLRTSWMPRTLEGVRSESAHSFMGISWFYEQPGFSLLHSKYRSLFHPILHRWRVSSPSSLSRWYVMDQLISTLALWLLSWLFVSTFPPLRSCCRLTFISSNLGHLKPVSLFNLMKGQMGLPHFKLWVLWGALTTDHRPYDCCLIIWYLLICITLIVADVSAMDAANDHHFTTLPIDYCMVEFKEDGDWEYKTTTLSAHLANSIPKVFFFIASCRQYLS